MYIMDTLEDLIGKKVLALKDFWIMKDIWEIRFSCLVTEDGGVLFPILSTFDRFRNSEKQDTLTTPIERYWFLSAQNVQEFLSKSGGIPLKDIKKYIEGFQQKNSKRLKYMGQMEEQMEKWLQEVDKLGEM